MKTKFNEIASSGFVKAVAIVALCLAQGAWGQQKGTFTDSRDGKKYKTVKIGKQTWMAENLSYGDKYKCYDGIPANCKKYGSLYSREEANIACPNDWHLPSNEEWQILVDFAGGEKIAGKKLKAKNGWKKSGTDNFGFAALPGAYNTESDYFDVGDNGYFLSNNGNCWQIDGYRESVGGGGGQYYCYSALSIRCLQDLSAEEAKVAKEAAQKAAEEAARELAEAIAANEARLNMLKGTLTDTRDSKSYKTIKIGEQEWMAENLNYNANGSKCYENNTSNCNIYGRLYDWKTAMKACPSGWHLPMKEEWEIMTNYIGGEATEGMNLKAKNGWNDHNGKSGNGEDKFGFATLPGGVGLSDGSFSEVGNFGLWWSASEYNADIVYFRGMLNVSKDAYWNNSYKTTRLSSVRCLRDDGNEKIVSLDEKKNPAATETSVNKEACDAETKKAKNIYDKCVKMGKGTSDYKQCAAEYHEQKEKAEKECGSNISDICKAEIKKAKDIYSQCVISKGPNYKQCATDYDYENQKKKANKECGTSF